MYIRWFIAKDMPDVLRIEQESFEFPWDYEDFNRYLRQRHCVGTAIENNQCRLCGYMVYEVTRDTVHLLSMAVDPRYRRLGYGSGMLDKLCSRLSVRHRNRIILEVRESNLAAQVFFRTHGFLCISTLRGYHDNGEDAYQLQYRYDKGREVIANILHGDGRTIKSYKEAST